MEGVHANGSTVLESMGRCEDGCVVRKNTPVYD